MSQPENLGSFFKQVQELLMDYVNTRLETAQLKAVRSISQILGTLIWIIISLFLVFLVIIFVGLVVGFWFTQITGSYIAGFAIATGFIVLLLILATLLRKVLFINPLIRLFLQKSQETEE
ncbi:MAG: hypothetical protein K2P88_07785 [Chitinophagaceae bacterium]|uniref:hypothetical protein n=1 Tax=unclassified Paraflavitalea TaxID=2798305 RepID=UPI003D34A5CD|nr:hypothetical protein [Chitinophagaceae bacterium]